MDKRFKYTDYALSKAVSVSYSVAEVLRRLRIEKLSGGMHSHISRRIQTLQLDISHMTGQAWHRGKQSKRRLTPEDIFVKNRRKGYREHTHLLKRAMIESGVPYECNKCGQGGTWQNEPITLDIDHINCDYEDNRKKNLRFLCPNCHSQR